MRKFLDVPNVDNSNPPAYPDGRIKDNTGSGDGTPVNEQVYGDIYQTFLKAKRLYAITENGMPDNETNGFQIIDALRALASKNDFILPITSTGGVLVVPVKIGKMLENEQIVCRATVNMAAETQITGSDSVTVNAAISGAFKANEYVRLIKTSGGVQLIRLVDISNLDLVNTDLAYLKKASQIQNDAGLLDTVATTPLVDKQTFLNRVNGAQSGDYLASQSRNGLMSIADKTKLDNFESNVKNIGWISGVNPGSGGTISASGDVTGAVVTSSGGGRTAIQVTVANSLVNTNYFVRMSVQSMSGNINTDTEIQTPVFKPTTATSFTIAIRETEGATQNLRIHIETVKI